MKEKIRNFILSQGADVCGFAGEERIALFPDGYSPVDIFPECKTVISFGIALPKGITKVSPRLVYAHYNDIDKNLVDNLTFTASKMIERNFGCIAVPMPCDSPYEYWDAENLRGRGLISMKDAAVYAGLGSIGKSTLLINRDFGNLLTIGAILTDLALDSDELCENLCINGCTKCIDSCPVGAINSDGTVTQKLCRENTYHKNARGFDTVECNTCRTVCPLRYGIPIKKSKSE